MLVLFKMLLARAVMFIAGALLLILPDGSPPGTGVVKQVVKYPARIAVSLSGSEETAQKKDTTTAEGKEEKKEKEKKSIRISISDKGIKVNSEKGEEFVLELDPGLIPGEVLQELGKSQEEIMKELERGLGGVPESIRIRLEKLREERFRKVRGSDLVRFGEDVSVSWNELVRGDVVTIFGDAEVDGKVMGDVVSVMGDVELGSSAIVNGQVVSILGGLEREEGAKVRGETVIVGGGSPNISLGFPSFHPRRGVVSVLKGIILLIVGILLIGIVIAFLPERMEKSSTYVFGSFFKSLGIGALIVFVGSILVGIVCAIFAITVIGIPIAILLGISYGVFFMLGYFVSAFAVGKAVVAKLNLQISSAFVQGFTGLFILALLGLISRFLGIYPLMGPLSSIFGILGGFLMFIALLTGLGSIILSRGGKLATEEKRKIPQEIE